MLPLRDTLLFPDSVVPVTVCKESTLGILKSAQESGTPIVAVGQRHDQETVSLDDVFDVGTQATIMRVVEVSENQYSVILRGTHRVRLHPTPKETTAEGTTAEGTLWARAERHPERAGGDKAEQAAILERIRESSIKVRNASPTIPEEMNRVIASVQSLAFLVNFMAGQISTSIGEQQKLLEIDTITGRGRSLIQMLEMEVFYREIEQEVELNIDKQLEEQQREQQLRQKLSAIRSLLKEEDQVPSHDLQRKFETVSLPGPVRQKVQTDLDRLSRMQPLTPSRETLHAYIERVLDYPWSWSERSAINLDTAQTVLEARHYGMQEAKQRVLEHLAVLTLRGDLRGPILCLQGPPGVGKTSIARSIADAIQRPLVRVSLGGVRDESEIRGHRRAYVGAQPGQIIRGIERAGCPDPVFLLDEIDKLGAGEGDPRSALLEVLDPEQNDSFRDHYFDVPVDLSRVLFVTTANNLSAIPPALRDRLEIITLNGYTTTEKIRIAHQHLIPQQCTDHGIRPSFVSVEDDALRTVIQGYTQEAGVRQLERRIATLVRGAALAIAREETDAVQVTEARIEDYLGPRVFFPEQLNRSQAPGLVPALAYTASGGIVLSVEVALLPGTGAIQITGRVGDIMQESVQTALSFLRSRSERLGIDPEMFETRDVHLHIPSGGMSKDGPSAGMAIVSALASAFTNQPAVSATAMTGEVTLSGRVLPVGFIREKLLAAQQLNVQKVFLPRDNESHVRQIDDEDIQNLSVHYFDSVDHVLDASLGHSLEAGDGALSDPSATRSSAMNVR